MKRILFATILVIVGFYFMPLFAQVAPVPTVAPAIGPQVVPTTPTSLLLWLGALVLGINGVLSVAQSVFTKLGKGEPGWLVTASNIVAKVAAFLAGNTPSA